MSAREKKIYDKAFLNEGKDISPGPSNNFSFVSFVSQILKLVYYFQFERVNFFISAKLLFFQVQK